ncbi:MAG: hypothetical protein JSW14_04860 [Candidatus Bathyarchaeum sp.]|nr:MAG: hypothetical protein JSW14_04860 [Candidatus Bathyarchaeum sp.]
MNGPLYDYGLVFDWKWYNEYSFIYDLLWQVAIITLTLLSRNLYFFPIAEAFHKTGAQDIFFYLIWCEGKFPEGEWFWSGIPGYTTITHVINCLWINGLVISICVAWYFVARRIDFYKRFSKYIPSSLLKKI